jgi:hypothetical protein
MLEKLASGLPWATSEQIVMLVLLPQNYKDN